MVETKRGLIVGVIVAVVLILIVIGYWGKFSATGNIARDIVEVESNVIAPNDIDPIDIPRSIVNVSCEDTDGGG